MRRRIAAAGDCGCGCGGTCGLPAPAPLGAGAVMSSRETRSLDRVALDYQRLMRGAGLTPVDRRGDYSDASDAEIQRALDAAIARGDDSEIIRLRSIQAERAEGHAGGTDAAAESRFASLSEAKRRAIATAAARQAGADDAQTAAAVTTALTRGLAALNDYLAGRFRVRIAEINSARDIAIARIGSEERIRLRLLGDGTTAPQATTSTTTVAAVSGLALLALLLRGGR